MKFDNIMIDLETLGTGSNSVILSIAAVPFCLSEDVYPDSFFSANVDIQSCLELGMKVDGATILWWMDMNKETIKEATSRPIPVTQMLMNFSMWFRDILPNKEVKVWAKGPGFDLSILSEAYRMANLPQPWRYSRERCVRTYIDGWEEELRRDLGFSGNRHNAIDDADYQIKCMRYVAMRTLSQ